MNLTTFDWEAAVRTVYGEARGEDYQGKLAVACVIWNRMQIKNRLGMRPSAAEVCLKSAQFSCWNADDPNREGIGNLNMHMVDKNSANGIALEECKTAVNNALTETSVDITNGATHYMTVALYERITHDPQQENHWANKMIKTRIIGNHVFMRQP